jgi:Transposase DDE domain
VFYLKDEIATCNKILIDVKNESKQLFQHECKKNFYSFFESSEIKRLSKESGFSKRKAKKISAINFVVGFFLMALQNSNTYSNWAHQISLLSSRIISKQGLCERMGKPAVKLVLSLLEKQVKQAYQTVRSKDLFAQFKRVLIQDSTTLNLPKELANQFPGNKAKGRQRAVARIQSVYDLIHNRFCFFGLHSYVENDQSAAMQLIHYLKAGDLLIRDLGYFTLMSIENIIKRHAYFLSRLPHNVSIFDLQSKEKLDIFKTSERKRIL